VAEKPPPPSLEIDMAVTTDAIIYDEEGKPVTLDDRVVLLKRQAGTGKVISFRVGSNVSALSSAFKGFF
jgi:hypothetical protein